jgi:predicted RNase H-like HicB family nuclease
VFAEVRSIAEAGMILFGSGRSRIRSRVHDNEHNEAVTKVRYKVVLHTSEEGFGISCPGLPGCGSQGRTEQEALKNIQDAISEYLAAVAESTIGSPVR